MKKQHRFDELSDKVCSTPGCDRRLKKRIVELKPTADKCYRCFVREQQKRGKFMKSKKRTQPAERFTSKDRRELQKQYRR